MYVIAGATGNIGNVIVENLLKQGQKVRAIARDANRLNDLAQRGAEIMPGSLDNSEFLAHVFEGSTAVFRLIPPNMTATDARKFQDSIGALQKTLSRCGTHSTKESCECLNARRKIQRLLRSKTSRVMYLRLLTIVS